MNIVAYYLALTNLHAMCEPDPKSIHATFGTAVIAYMLDKHMQILGGRGPDLDDVIVKISDLDTLSTYLRSYPDFNIESFKKDRVNRVGDVGLFISNNLGEYCLNGKGNPNDEGIIVTFTFKEKGSGEEDHTRKKLESHPFLIRKDGLREDRIRPLLEELNKQPHHHNRFVVIRDPKEEETNEPN